MSVFQKMKDVYHLDKDSFTLVPELDWVCYFGRNQIENELERNVIAKAFSANRPPKAVIYGYWGMGKTQTFWRLINTSLKDQDCLYVELPEFPTNTPFLIFYSDLMNKVSRPNFRKQAIKIKQNFEGFDEFYKTKGGPGSEVANIFSILDTMILVSEDSAEEILIWSWLCGNKIKSPTAIGLPDGANEIRIGEAISFLWILGKFNIEINERFLIFCIDEAHRLGEISEDSYSERTFIQAFRVIFLKDFPLGFLFSVGVGEEDELPHMFIIGEVRTRIGLYIHLQNYSEPEINDTIRGIIRYVRDGATWDFSENQISWNETKVEVSDIINDLNLKSVDVNVNGYPFTEDAIEQLIEYLMDAPYILYRTPRRLCDCLDFISSERDALDQGYINRDVVMIAFPKYVESSPLAEE